MKRFLQIFSVMLLSCLAVVLFGIATKPQAQAAGGGPVECTTGKGAVWVNAGFITCDEDGFIYDPVQTAANSNSPVFVSQKSGTSGAGDPPFYIKLGVASDGTLGYHIYDSKGVDQGTANVRGSSSAKFVFKTKAGKEFCSVVKSTDCDPFVFPAGTDGRTYLDVPSDVPTEILDQLGNYNIDSAHYSGPGLSESVQKALGTAADKTKDAASCGIDNALSFFLCPVRDLVVTSIDNLTSYLQGQLAIIPLQGGGDLQKAFDNFRNIANSLYIIIFLVIIFSNFFSTGLDNYSIKKMLPRLLAAVIATQFGFLICTILIDLSNIIAIVIPSALNNGTATIGTNLGAQFDSVVNSAQTASTTAGAAAGAAATTGFVLIVLVLYIVGLIILAIALCYLVFRNIFLIVLVFISPLAFAAWVLPQTQQYAKKWATWFIKLLAMGPIIGLILGGTVLMQNIFTASGNNFLKFAAFFIPFVGLALIPKSLKWSADVMTATGKAVQDSAVGKGATKAGQKSYKEGQVGKNVGKLVGGVGGKVPGFGTRATKYGAKKEAAYNSAQKENYGAFGVDDLVKLSSASGATGKNARSALGRKRSEMGYELSRNANNGLAPSEKQLKDLRKMNEALAKEGEPAILPNIPTGTAMPTDPEGNNWADTVNMVQPGNNGPVVNGGTGGSSTPTTPPPAPPSGGGSSGSPTGSSGGGTPTPAGPTPGQRAANASAGGRQRRQQAAASNPNAGQFNQRIADESVDVPTANQQVDDAAQRARDIIDSLNNPKPPTTP